MLLAVAVAVVVVVLLAGATVGGLALLAEDDPAPGSAATDGSGDPGADRSPGTGTSASDPAPSGPTASGRPAPTATCWDGTTEPTVDRCTAPVGRPGLAWVFPGVPPDRCRPSSHDSTRAVFLNCEVGGVRYNLTEWGRYADGAAHYDENLGTTSVPRAGGQEIWRGISPRCEWKAALMYPGRTWSATVYASTRAERDEGVQRLRMRPVAQLRGTGS